MMPGDAGRRGGFTGASGWGFLLRLAGWLMLSGPAWGHSASTAWLQVTVSNQVARVQLELPWRDLDEALGLDANGDGELTWGEVRSREGDLEAFVRDGLRLDAGGGTLAWSVGALQVSERLGVPCAAWRLSAPLPAPLGGLGLDYGFFFESDPLHRCLVGGGVVAVLSPARRRVELAAPAGGPVAVEATAGWGNFVREGLHHIWTGYDHLAFLLVLLLPAGLGGRPAGRGVGREFGDLLVPVLKVVTAFTVAHSLTLGLAAFQVICLPTRLVEATIAGSILVAATLGMMRSRRGPMAFRGGVLVAFGFGLVHGFGFAGVLGELGLARAQLATALLGFNLGVEVGQLMCVAVFLPVAFILQGTAFYRHGVWPVGTVLVALVAGGWFVERVFAVPFMPF